MAIWVWLFTWLFSTSLAWGGIVLDGIDDYGDSNTALSAFITASTASMSVWYMPTGDAPVGACNDASATLIIGDTQGFWKINRRSGPQVCVGNSDGAIDVVQTAYTVNVPTHIVLVHTGGNILMYKDGAQVGSPVASGDTATLTNQIHMGGNAFFDYEEGLFYHAAVYNVALSAAEVEARYRSRALRLGSTMATGEWELDACEEGFSADTLVMRDISGNNRNLTIDNGANNTGTLCIAHTHLTNPYGVQ